MKNETIVDLFSRDGQYHFARWSKQVSPVIFGVDDDTLLAIKVAFSDVLSLASLKLVEFDQELGANFLMFFCTEWSELLDVPNLGKLVPDLQSLLETLCENGSNQYRTFSFTPDKAINLVIILLKYDAELASVSVQTLAVSQALQSVLLWSPTAFLQDSPIAILQKSNRCIVKPFYAALIKAAYDPVLPNHSLDKSHALRLKARVDLFLEPK